MNDFSKKGDENTQKYNKKICQRILQYLLMKDDHQESVNGLILEICNAEIKQLSQEIVNNLGYLISAGLIKEIEETNGKRKYRLLKKEEEISQFLHIIAGAEPPKMTG